MWVKDLRRTGYQKMSSGLFLIEQIPKGMEVIASKRGLSPPVLVVDTHLKDYVNPAVTWPVESIHEAEALSVLKILTQFHIYGRV